MNKEERAWYRGAVAAVSTLWHMHPDDVVFDDVVNNLDPDLLVEVARKDGNMRWSGLSGYLRRKRAREARG